MGLPNLIQLFARDIARFKNEIELYSEESHLWEVIPGTSNSGGNLCLHLIGNLNAYIGVGLAGSNYIRDRPYEFEGKAVPRTILLQEIDKVSQVVQQGLSSLSLSTLEEDFPIRIWDKPSQMEYTLIHLLTHLSYHLGQINYHRRYVES